jgi:hypothetical protein
MRPAKPYDPAETVVVIRVPKSQHLGHRGNGAGNHRYSATTSRLGKEFGAVMTFFRNAAG